MREGLGQQAHRDPGTRYRWKGINSIDKKAGRSSKVKYITRMEGKGEISVSSSSTNPVVEYRSPCGVIQHERRREEHIGVLEQEMSPQKEQRGHRNVRTLWTAEQKVGEKFVFKMAWPIPY